MYMLVDTNICIYINKNNPPQVLKKFRSIPLNQICMSSVTYAELFHGAMKSEQIAKNLEKITKLKMMISILPFDESAAQQYGIIRSNLEKRGLIIGSNDLLIAAHALSENCILVSNNLREFNRVENLRTENWS